MGTSKNNSFSNLIHLPILLILLVFTSLGFKFLGLNFEFAFYSGIVVASLYAGIVNILGTSAYKASIQKYLYFMLFLFIMTTSWWILSVVKPENFGPPPDNFTDLFIYGGSMYVFVTVSVPGYLIGQFIHSQKNSKI